MHDLNDALDELRSVIPYAHSPSVRKLSKIATLLLAKNYILMQGKRTSPLVIKGYLSNYSRLNCTLWYRKRFGGTEKSDSGSAVASCPHHCPATHTCLLRFAARLPRQIVPRCAGYAGASYVRSSECHGRWPSDWWHRCQRRVELKSRAFLPQLSIQRFTRESNVCGQEYSSTFLL